MSFDYWKETISCVCDDEQINITESQINLIAEAVEISHDNYGLFTGQDVATSNFNAARESELAELKDKVSDLESKLANSITHDSHQEDLSSLNRNWRNKCIKLEQEIEELTK